jgi:hypothetical protein
LKSKIDMRLDMLSFIYMCVLNIVLVNNEKIEKKKHIKISFLTNYHKSAEQNLKLNFHFTYDYFNIQP